MEEELIKEILFLKKYYHNAELEECTKEVLRTEQGRQTMKSVCTTLHLTTKEYVEYLTNLAKNKLNGDLNINNAIQ